jgi:hypothetical protein
MSATKPVATRPDRAGGAPTGGCRHLSLALVVIATAQLMVVPEGKTPQCPRPR